MATITTNDGVRIYYEEAGRGKPLVLIHGWSCSGRFFKSNVDELAKACRVINMDLRGHGKSGKPQWGYRISRMAKDVKDLIEALDLQDVTLLGWSMGGSVIWSYLDLFGNEHLKRVVIVDQSPRQYVNTEWTWGGGCIDAEALAVLTTRLEYDVKSVSTGVAQGCLSKEATPEEEAFFVEEMLQCPGWVQGAIMADHTHLDWRDLLPKIDIPTLVLVARKGKIFPWQGCAYVGEQIPGAETVFFEEGGHMLFYEEPEKFNRVVADFVGESD